MGWGALVPTLVGGAISLVSSIVIFSIAQGAERKRRNNERKEEQAAAAFVGLHKLIISLNAVENLARHIDLEFRTAEEDGGDVLEPAAIVRPIVGTDHNIEDLHVREFAFLLDETGELASQVAEIQERCKNTFVAVQAFNDLKADYDKFAEKNAEVHEVDGPIARMSFKGKEARFAELKVARMNLLLAEIIGSVEEDRKQVKQVATAFIDKAVEVFGDKFPAKRLEVREP